MHRVGPEMASNCSFPASASSSDRCWVSGRFGSGASLPALSARSPEAGQQPACRGDLLVRLAVDSGSLEQTAQLQTLAGVDGRTFGPEVGARHLRLIELRRVQRHTVRGGPEVTGSEQADECCVDGIPRPTVGRIGEMRTHVSPPLAGADEGQDGGAYRVLLGLAAVVEHLERMFGTSAGAFDHLRPPVVVRVVELVKEANQGRRRRPPEPCRAGSTQAVRCRRPGSLWPRGPRRPPAPADCSPPLIRRVSMPWRASMAFGRRRHPLVLQGSPRSAPISDETRETFRLRPRHEHVDDGAVRSGRTRVGNHCVLPGTPTVAHPHRDVTATVRWWVGAEVEARACAVPCSLRGTVVWNPWRYAPSRRGGQSVRSPCVRRRS